MRAHALFKSPALDTRFAALLASDDALGEVAFTEARSAGAETATAVVTAILEQELASPSDEVAPLAALRVAADLKLAGTVPALVACVLAVEDDDLWYATLSAMVALGTAAVGPLLAAFDDHPARMHGPAWPRRSSGRGCATTASSRRSCGCSTRMPSRGRASSPSSAIPARSPPSPWRSTVPSSNPRATEMTTSRARRSRTSTPWRREGTLEAVILHEMLHVVGFGTMWPTFGLLAGAGGANPTFTGARAAAAFVGFNEARRTRDRSSRWRTREAQEP